MTDNNREVRSAAAPSVSGRRVSGMAVVFNSPSRYYLRLDEGSLRSSFRVQSTKRSSSEVM